MTDQELNERVAGLLGWTGITEDIKDSRHRGDSRPLKCLIGCPVEGVIEIVPDYAASVTACFKEIIPWIMRNYGTVRITFGEDVDVVDVFYNVDSDSDWGVAHRGETVEIRGYRFSYDNDETISRMLCDVICSLVEIEEAKEEREK